MVKKTNGVPSHMTPAALTAAKSLFLEVEDDGEGGQRRKYSLLDIQGRLEFENHFITQPALSQRLKSWKAELPDGVHYDRRLSIEKAKNRLEVDTDGRTDAKKRVIKRLERLSEHLSSLTTGLKSRDTPMTHENFTKKYKDIVNASITCHGQLVKALGADIESGKAGNTYNIQLVTGTPARQSQALRDVIRLSNK